MIDVSNSNMVAPWNIVLPKKLIALANNWYLFFICLLEDVFYASMHEFFRFCVMFMVVTSCRRLKLYHQGSKGDKSHPLILWKDLRKQREGIRKRLSGLQTSCLSKLSKKMQTKKEWLKRLWKNKLVKAL